MITIHITEKQFEYILKKIDKVCNYYEIDDDTFENIMWYRKEMTSLPFEIGILESVIDDKNQFPLLFYKDNNDIIQTIAVSYNPKLNNKPNLTVKQKQILYSFVKNNVETLYLVSHGTIDTMQCLSSLDFNCNHVVLKESPTLNHNTSGLPTDLWLDAAQEYKKGGHGPRIKFKDGASNKTREFKTMTISDNPEIINNNTTINLKQKDINLIKKFVLKNKDLLLLLINGEISFYTDFIPQMFTPDKKGNFNSHATHRNNYKKITQPSFNISVVESNDGLYNFYNEEEGGLISKIWFDNFVPFTKIGSDIIARGKVNNYWYTIYLNGDMSYLGR